MRPIATIVGVVSDLTGTAPLDIRSARRQYALHRHLVMWVARHTTLCSYPQIARALGKRDHTTIMHGVRVIDRRIASDPAFAKLAQAARARAEAAIGEAGG